MLSEATRDYMEREYPRRPRPAFEIIAISLSDGEVHRERVATDVADGIVARMTALGSRVWLEEDYGDNA